MRALGLAKVVGEQTTTDSLRSSSLKDFILEEQHAGERLFPNDIVLVERLLGGFLSPQESVVAESLEEELIVEMIENLGGKEPGDSSTDDANVEDDELRRRVSGFGWFELAWDSREIPTFADERYISGKLRVEFLDSTLMAVVACCRDHWSRIEVFSLLK